MSFVVVCLGIYHCLTLKKSSELLLANLTCLDGICHSGTSFIKASIAIIFKKSTNTYYFCKFGFLLLCLTICFAVAGGGGGSIGGVVLQ